MSIASSKKWRKIQTQTSVRQETALLKHLNSIQQLLETRGKLKVKKFNSLVESMQGDQKVAQMLGPYGPKARSASGSKVFEESDFEGLVEGVNAGKVTLGKVICSVHSEESVPL